MANQISALDIHFLMRELQVLLGGKVNKVYMPDKKKAIIEFFVSGKGKHYLKIYAPEYLCISGNKESSEEDHFCTLLRKRLNNTRLKEISQIGFERIVKLFFEGKEDNYIIFAELFSRGNIIFCKEDLTIVYASESKKWKDRTLRGGIKYELPPETANTLILGEDDFIGSVMAKDRDLVKVLAKDLSLGGKYSELLCTFADIDKNKFNIKRADAEKLYSCWQKLLKKKLSPFVIVEGDNSIDFLPFELNKTDKNKKSFNTFSEAIDFFFSSKTDTKTDLAEQKYQQKIDSVKKILEQQESKIKEFEKAIDENKLKGEYIYTNYAVIKDILDELTKARKKYSWKDIVEKLKGHKVIKEVNGKEGKIIIDV